jgi:hypothetical protein
MGAAGVFSKLAAREWPSGSPSCSAMFLRRDVIQPEGSRRLPPEVPRAPQELAASAEAVAVRPRREAIAEGSQKASAAAAARRVSDAVGGCRNRKHAPLVHPSEALRRGERKGYIQRVAEKSQHGQRVAGGRGGGA